MGTQAMVIVLLSAALLVVISWAALFWQMMQRKEVAADRAAYQEERDQLRLLCRQQESELTELRSAVRAEKAHVGQLQRQLSLRPFT